PTLGNRLSRLHHRSVRITMRLSIVFVGAGYDVLHTPVRTFLHCVISTVHVVLTVDNYAISIKRKIDVNFSLFLVSFRVKLTLYPLFFSSKIRLLSTLTLAYINRNPSLFPKLRLQLIAEKIEIRSRLLHLRDRSVQDGPLRMVED